MSCMVLCAAEFGCMCTDICVRMCVEWCRDTKMCLILTWDAQEMGFRFEEPYLTRHFNHDPSTPCDGVSCWQRNNGKKFDYQKNY